MDIIAKSAQGCILLIGIPVVLIAGIAVYKFGNHMEGKAESAQVSEDITEKVSVENLVVRNVGEFLPRVEADFSVVNRGNQAIKDFTVKLIGHGSSGTAIHGLEKTFYDVLNPGEALDYTAQNMGPRHSQDVSYTARLSWFTIIPAKVAPSAPAKPRVMGRLVKETAP